MRLNKLSRRLVGISRWGHVRKLKSFKRRDGRAGFTTRLDLD